MIQLRHRAQKGALNWILCCEVPFPVKHYKYGGSKGGPEKSFKMMLDNNRDSISYQRGTDGNITKHKVSSWTLAIFQESAIQYSPKFRWMNGKY